MFHKAEASSPPKCNELNILYGQQFTTKKAVKCEPPEPDNDIANSRFEELQLTLVEQHPLVVPLLRALWLDEDSKDMVISTADGAVIKCHKNIFRLASQFCSDLLTGCQEDGVVTFHLPDINSSSVECFLNVLYCVSRVSPSTKIEMEVLAECLKIKDKFAAHAYENIPAKKTGSDRLVRHPKAFSEPLTTNCDSHSVVFPEVTAVKPESTVKTVFPEEPFIETDNDLDLQVHQNLCDVVNDQSDKKPAQVMLSDSSPKTADANRPFKCSKCDKRFSRKDHLKEHVKWHCEKSEHEDLKLQCLKCEKTLSNPQALRRHEKEVHGLLQISPEERELWRQGLFAANTCTKCDMSFPKRKELIDHEKKVHEESPPAMCTTCGKSFANLAYLKQHERSHKDKKYTCTRCDKNFRTLSYLKVHEESMHDGIRSFLCSHCDKKFGMLNSLKKHEMTHTGERERPFECKVCKKRFIIRKLLQRHELIHTGEKPFSCTKCDKRFTQTGQVKRHELLHTGAKPFKCEKCGKCFAQNSHLTRHMKIHSEEKQNSQAT